MPELGNLTPVHPLVATAEVEGEEINVTFDRNRVTMRWLAGVQAMMRDNDAQSMSDLMAEVVHEWDITDDGQPYPPTADNLAALPAHVLGAIFGAIETASEPGAAEGNASPDTSSSGNGSSTPTPESPPTSGPPSPSPTHLASLPTR